jgi:hypothetical protein
MRIVRACRATVLSGVQKHLHSIGCGYRAPGRFEASRDFLGALAAGIGLVRCDYREDAAALGSIAP